MQVHDARTTGMHWQIGKGGGYHYAVAETGRERLPVTVFLGGPPALILSAMAPLPENVPELMLASPLAGERLPQVHGHGPHPLIASAEFALIGDVPPRVRKPEGPFGDHYGYYSLQHDYPASRSAESHTEPTRSIPRPSSANHGRKISSSAICSRNCCHRSSPSSCPLSSVCGRTARPDITRWLRRSSSNGIAAKPWRARFAFLARVSSH